MITPRPWPAARNNGFWAWASWSWSKNWNLPMAWRDKSFGSKTHLAKVLFQLYTKDGTRGAEVRARQDGKFYFVPLEHMDGTDWKMIPSQITVHASEQEAEAAAVNSPWFLRGERPKP